MLVSQLIYTGCGKDRTGAFSVWSKSRDITKNEELEIQDKMIYKRPAGLPYEPTQEEIESLFPKKLGYFNLTSGRVCLAQSVYVGNVYCDADVRMGNYIIHAFVFDRTEELLPMRFIGSELFRRGLTYEEWHDSEAPDDLPQIEIDGRQTLLTDQEVARFFDKENAERLEMLLQAILNASSSEQTITFYDKHENLRYWYKALSICLPASMQKNLTFNTFYTPGMSMLSQMPGSGSAVQTEVKIRNISPTVVSSLFSYQQEARAGKYAFDFESGVFPAGIAVGSFVRTAVRILKDHVNDAADLVDSVVQIRDKCGVDLNTASEIHFLLTAQIGRIDDTEKIEKLLGYAKEYYPDALPDIADTAYEYGFRSGRWTLSKATAGIFRFIFDYSDTADKGDMIGLYIENQEACGVDRNAFGIDYCLSVQSSAPFAWVNFLDYIFDGDNIQKYFAANGTEFNSKCLIFDTFAKSISEIARDPERKSIVMNYFVECIKECIRQEQLREVLAYLGCIGECGDKWSNGLIREAYSELAGDGRLSDACRPEFTLSLAQSCNAQSCNAQSRIDPAIAKELISRLIRENENDEDFIKLYLERYAGDPAFYSAIFEELNAQSEFSAFLENIELYRFAKSQDVTRKMLSDYYEQYVLSGKDDGLFAEKLRQYLSRSSGKECLRESIRCYDEWLKDREIDEQLLRCCTDVICEAVFSQPAEVLREYIVYYGNTKIEEMLDVLRSSGASPVLPNHYSVIVFGEKTKKLAEDLKNKRRSGQDTLDSLDEGSFYRIPLDENSCELFVKWYLEGIFALYFELANEENFEMVYTRLLEPIHACAGFDRMFREELSKLNESRYECFLGDTIICACSMQSSFNSCLMGLAGGILENLGRGRTKKFFAKLLENVPGPYEKKTRAFIEHYQKDHESLFDKLFGGRGKKNEDDDAPKDSGKKKKK